MVNDFRGVAEEFNECDDEYQDFVQRLSRQDIDLMVRVLYSEIAITERSNRLYIRKLKTLHPVKIWSGG